MKVESLKLKVAFLSALLVLLLASCGKKHEQKAEKPFVVVSIEPQRYFVEKLVGDKFEVRTVLKKGNSPELFDPTPAQVMEYGKSKSYFMLGVFPFEEKMRRLLQENNPNVELINTSAAVFSDMKDDSLMHDPHYWCSTKNVATMSSNIYISLCLMDSVNKAYYIEKFKRVLSEIETTHSLIREKLRKLKTRDFIIYHPALTYFAKEFGLTQHAIEEDGKAASPAHMSELVNLAKQKGIKIIFVQPEFDKKNAEVLAKEIDARVVEINPLAYDWREEMLKIAEALENQ